MVKKVHGYVVNEMFGGDTKIYPRYIGYIL